MLVTQTEAADAPVRMRGATSATVRQPAGSGGPHQPQCKLTGTTPVLRPTRHVYLDLPALTPQLQAYITASSQAGGWSTNCVQVRPAPSPGASDRAVAVVAKHATPGVPVRPNCCILCCLEGKRQLFTDDFDVAATVSFCMTRSVAGCACVMPAWSCVL